MTVEIRDIAFDAQACAAILAEGAAGDGAFLLRLQSEWASGACRFDRPGEFLIGAFDGGALVAVGGVSLDPYHPEPGLGRVRHVYVPRAHRRRGIGRRLIEEMLRRARRDFAMLRLRTERPEAAALYQSLGFACTDAPGETHRLMF